MCQDNHIFGRVPITWELFKTTFLEIFFSRDMRESMVEEFINLKLGYMKIREYSLKFVNLLRYATSLVSTSRDEMKRFLTGINGDLEKKCRSAMLHDNMDLSRFTVHAQQVEDNHKKRGISYTRRPKPQNTVGPNHGGHIFRIWEQPRFKKGQQSSCNSNSQRSTEPR